MCLIAALLIVELRAISKDRADNETEANRYRMSQQKEFESIRDAQNKDFAATASGLQSAIHGIDSTLRSANETLMQTRPFAALHINNMGIEDPAVNQFVTGTPYGFRFEYINEGNRTAIVQDRLGRVYVGMPDDKETQKELAIQFEEDWKNAPRPPNTKLQQVPHETGFWSESKSFSQDDLQMLNRGGTVYLFARIEYSDSTGRFRVDECEHFQRRPGNLDIRIGHPCL